MQDIFITDPRQASAKEIAKNIKKYKKPKRKFIQYFFDLIIKTLLVFSVLALDLVMFAQAGGYNMFSATQELSMDLGIILSLTLLSSFVIIFLLSFSLTLQNFVVSAAIAIVFLAICNQFLLVDPGSILIPYAEHLGSIGTEIFSYFSHYIIAAAIFIVSFILITYLKRKTQFYIAVLMLVLIGFNVFKAYNNYSLNYSKIGANLNDESIHPDSRNIVYIGLVASPSVYKLQTFTEQTKSAKIKETADNMLGFYQKNNFTYYPNSYLKYIKQPYMNLIDTLNPQNEKGPEDVLLSSVILDGYWNFSQLTTEKMYIQKNHVFDLLHKKDYNLRIYQNKDIELCYINNNLSVNRCQTRIGNPIDLSQSGFTTTQKAGLLFAQWMESTGLVKNVDPILGFASAFERDIKPLHFTTNNLQSYNAFKYLDIIASDISSDRGNNIYFAILNIPDNLYIYDSMCNIKPLSQWVSATDNETNINLRKEALAEQTNCLYGRLEKFIQDLEKSGNLKQTSIIIQGLDTVLGGTPGIEKDLYKSMHDTKIAGLAIFDPLKPQANIDNRFCTSSSLIYNHLNKNDKCQEFQGIQATDNLKNTAITTANANQISGEDAAKAQASFQRWYQSWAAHNQVENIDKSAQIPLEKNINSEETNKVVETVPVADVIADLPPENQVKPIAETKKGTPVEVKETTSNNISDNKEVSVQEEKKEPVSEDKLTKPEQLKEQFKQQQAATTNATKEQNISKVNIEVKVIDKEENTMPIEKSDNTAPNSENNENTNKQ
ncbi:MAG: hypothetical protein IKL33_01375 [Alphaproteobacteria bacterium]|nr:hypothetical protein [Alphaproteobacteria bacterium]